MITKTSRLVLESLYDEYDRKARRLEPHSGDESRMAATALRAALDAIHDAERWQPISTAPRVRPILACVAGTNFYPDKVQWTEGVGWTYPCGSHGPSLLVTHWRYLPFNSGAVHESASRSAGDPDQSGCAAADAAQVEGCGPGREQ